MDGLRHLIFGKFAYKSRLMLEGATSNTPKSWSGDLHMITGPYMRVDMEDEYNILMCYSFDDRVNSMEDPHEEGKTILFRTNIGEFRFYVDESEMFMPGVRPGILFSIHSPFVAVNPMENGIFMKPGRSYVIYVSLEEEILLKNPYETDCINYTEFWERNGRVGPRSQEMCKHRCFQDISMACFNCVAPIFLFPTKEKLCSLASDEMDESKCPDTIFEDVIKCQEDCKDDCKRRKYSYNVQERFSMKFDDEGHVLEDIDRLIFVKVYLEDDEVIVLQHSPKYMAYGVTCLTKKDLCGPDECCVQSGLVGSCKRIIPQGETCVAIATKSLTHDHAYKISCPCAKGSKCVEDKDGFTNFFGTCEEDSSEVTVTDE